MIFKYLKNNTRYRVLEEGKLKCPETGEWVECVFYMSMKDGKVYAREKEDFYEKFKPE